MRSRIFRFLLLLALCVASRLRTDAVDVAHFELLKGVHYYQIQAGLAYLQTNNMYRFAAQVYANNVGDVLDASIVTPAGYGRILLADADGDPFRYRGKYDDSFSLENNFPNGSYSFDIHGAHDGDHVMNFDLTGNTYPAAPLLNNFDTLQNLPFNEYNQISWQPFAGATSTDFIQLQIEDQNGNNIWETHDFNEDGALNGLATHTIVPPGTLTPGLVYIGTLRFVHVLQNSSPAYPGVKGTVGYYARTEFILRSVTPRISPGVDRLQVWRTRRFEQFTNAAPVEQTHPWEFDARIDAIGTNQITSAQIKFPSGLTSSLDTNIDLTQFEFSDTLQTNVTDFVALYPDGPYAFDVTRVDSTVQHATVNLAAGAFPPVPVFENLDPIPNRRADQDLTVTWNAWVGASEDDFIRVELFDGNNGVWNTSTFSSGSHLRADATSVTIPAINFTPGHNYELRLHFYHVTVSDTRMLPGALIFGGFDSRTRFQFSTLLPDVPTFRIAHGQYYWQRATNAYEADPIGPFRFEVSAAAALSNSLHSARVEVPTKGLVQLTPDSTSLLFQFNASEPSLEALARDYPTGVYTMHFETAADGVRTSSVVIASNTLPPIPHVQNFSTLAALPSTKDFTLTWDPWIGADTNKDSIHFLVTDLANRPVIDSNDPNTKHPLTASSNVVTILGNSSNDRELHANASYLVRIRFEHQKHTQNDSYHGSRGETALFSETAFYISTLDPKTPFKETALILPTTKEFQVRVTNPQIGRTYALYESQDLQTWTLVNTQRMTTAILTSFAPTNGAFFKAAILPYP